jgi:hypothetical protein
MDTARDALPDDIAALKEALATERAKALDIAAELAVARAKASEDSALDTQRREAVSAELAKRQNEQLRADMESAHQPVGAPIVLTPTNSPPTAAKRPVDRSKSTRCEEGSLSCSWAKFSAVVKNAFASSSRTKP